MATHSSVLAWGIPRTEEPGKSLGVHKRVEHDFKTKATTTIDKETEAQKMYTCGRFVLMFGKTNTVFQV